MGNTNSKSAPFSLSSFVFCVVIASGMARKFFRGSKRRMSGEERGGVWGRKGVESAGEASRSQRLCVKLLLRITHR